jgi:hypothetical protein
MVAIFQRRLEKTSPRELKTHHVYGQQPYKGCSAETPAAKQIDN